MPLVALAPLVAWAPICLAQNINFDDEDEDEGEPDSELERAISDDSSELELLRLSHLSEVYRWDGVQGLRKKRDTGAAWKVVKKETAPRRILVSPVSQGIASTKIAIPKRREYRVWLAYIAEPGKRHPVKLFLQGANKAEHWFGRIMINSSLGKTLEETSAHLFR